MSRRAVVASGAVVVAVYLAGALVSARLSPFARHPLLDGLAPAAPYRWVDPPANLADTNKPPTPGRFQLEFHGGTLDGGALQTPDAQVTVIVPHDAFAARAGQTGVTITVKPLSPAAFPAAPGSKVLLGNVVRIQAVYEPSGDRIEDPKRALEVAIVYPFVAADSGEHLMLQARADRWMRLDATDHLASAQLVASIASFGDIVAAGERLPSATTSPATAGSSRTGTIIAIAIGALLVIVLLVAVFRRGEAPIRR